MIVMITGSKEYSDRAAVENWIDTLPPETVLISAGSNTGPDAWARKRATARGDITVETIKAEWQGPLDHTSGKIRNNRMIARMLEIADPDKRLAAFLAKDPHGGWSENGKHAVTVARAAHIKVAIKPLAEEWQEPETVIGLPRITGENYQAPVASTFDLCGDDASEWLDEIP